MLQLELIDFDKEYEADMESGNGFQIFEKGISKTGVRNTNGIYSPLYGSDLSNEEVKHDRYQCECGHLIGKFYEGTTCELCGTEVTKQVDDIYKTGWISFQFHKLINPIMYNFISRVIGKTNLNRIVNFELDIDRDGHIQDNDDNKKNPYINYGLIRFKDNFDEIIDFFVKSRKIMDDEEKAKIYNFIMKNKKKIFISNFPVFSLSLRPILMIKNEVLCSDINKKYQLLVTWANTLNNCELTIDDHEVKILPIMYQAQLVINDLYQTIISDFLAEKKGLIRANLMGARLNFSSRSVIVPLVGETDIDEIHVPYMTFLELYKFELINMIANFDGVPINEANKRWNEATLKFDKKIYLLMKHLINNTEGGLKCLINRNPSLNLGSILMMRITDVKTDLEDLTISLPIYTLGLLAGDFDGDVVALIALKDKEIIDKFDPVFNPVFMFVDRNNGRFNRKLSLIKDQLIGLYAFCNH